MGIKQIEYEAALIRDVLCCPLNVTWNTYFGFLGGSLPSKPSSSDHKHCKLVVGHQLVATVGVYCKAAQM